MRVVFPPHRHASDRKSATGHIAAVARRDAAALTPRRRASVASVNMIFVVHLCGLVQHRTEENNVIYCTHVTRMVDAFITILACGIITPV